ncbi:MAG: DinB family protein [Terracidiphilus sp.]
MPKMTAADRDASLREHLLKLLTAEQAHVNFDSAIKNLPAELRGKRPKGADHSPWELLEHLRIAQSDILDFSRNPNYKALDWPSGYRPETPAPPDARAWDKSVRAFRKDLKTFCALIANPATDLYARIPHGDGQTILREAMLIADHNAYHVGQLVMVKKLLAASH